jgi:uncharacterized protein
MGAQGNFAVNFLSAKISRGNRNLGRIVVLLILAFVIYLLFRGFFRAQVKRDKSETARATSASGEDMVKCARCGVNLPRSEAQEQAGQLVCNDNPRCRGPE